MGQKVRAGNAFPKRGRPRVRLLSPSFERSIEYMDIGTIVLQFET